MKQGQAREAGCKTGFAVRPIGAGKTRLSGKVDEASAGSRREELFQLGFIPRCGAVGTASGLSIGMGTGTKRIWA
jgi:hypothetical protein